MPQFLVRAAVSLVTSAAVLSFAGRAQSQDATLTRMEWKVGDVTREALIYAPLMAKETPSPVVFAFHGHGGSMRNAANMFRIHEIWPEAVAIYMQGLPTAGRLTDPEGRRRGWQRTIGTEGDRDLRFFDAVLESAKSRWRVDASRIYATGHSNGGGFTYLLWATRGDSFAAVAPSSAVPSREEVPLLKPKPVLHLAGERDDLVRFAWQKPVMQGLRRLNGCEGDGQEWAKFATRYPSAAGNPVVTLIHPGGHRPPAGFAAIIVTFFKEHRRPDVAASKPAMSSGVETSPTAPETRPATRETVRVRPPNIVILLADDLGYADLGVQGCKDVPTPNIDAIARAGVRCTSGYSGHCVCAPARAALLSGRYQHRFGLENNPGPAATAAADYGLPRSVPTLAEKLKAAGYATGMVGKWHLGYAEGLRPHQRGFDHHFGFLGGAHPYLSGRRDAIVRNGEPVDEKGYLTDAFAREALSFIERSKDRPFFLYLAFNAVHSPLQATAKYEDRFAQIADPKRRTYAGMLSALDDAVGLVMAKLREIGREDDTIVFFYSDNGGPTQATTASNDPLRGRKGQLWEGGIRVPFFVRWKGRVPAGAVFEQPVMAFDIHATALAAAGVAGSPDLDGVDLVPFLATGKGVPHERVFWRAGSTHAARVGDWKLVRERDGSDRIFDLKADLGEQVDLAPRDPEKLAELQAAYAAWERDLTPGPRERRRDSRR